MEAGGPLALFVLIIKVIEWAWHLGDDDDDKYRYSREDHRYRNERVGKEERKQCKDFMRLSNSWRKYE